MAKHRLRFNFHLLIFLFLVAVLPWTALAQVTVATGGIQISVSDASGAAMREAKVRVVNNSTLQTLRAVTKSNGSSTFSLLTPGEYGVRVEVRGFKTAERSVTVQVGAVTTVPIRLDVGATTDVIAVQESSVNLQPDRSSVEGVLNTRQIETLPVNGRNFLDLAQLEPGVQMQDGVNFDPTKVGYSSISFGGRFGRSARIEVDGVDVSDETVGTTTQGIPASAIQEFQLIQSSLDLSNELTSSGAVNVVTRSGSNQWHGQAFSLFRDSAAAATLPAGPGLSAPFQRSEFGGRLGGPVVKNKLFFFTDVEHKKQAMQGSVSLPDPFTAFSGNYSAPYHETETLERLDYQINDLAHLFYRFTYFDLSARSTFWPSSFQVYSSKNYSRDHTVGFDFTTGSFVHSLRFSDLNFQNNIADATRGSGLPLADLPVSLAIGTLQTGPNLLAPQFTLQHDAQIKYDGIRVFPTHMLRFGADLNHIQDVGNAAFFGASPQVQINVGSTETSFADNSCGVGVPCFPGGHNNPLNYPVELVLLGTGQGYVSEKPALGYPAGGLGPDYRLGLYLGDQWRVKPNLTLTYGLRYVRATGRSDADLPGIPVLNSLAPGLGNPMHQPNLDFAPQVGFAYSPKADGKTVIRSGMGIFYDNSVFNNVYGDRPFRLPNGSLLIVAPACLAPGVAVPVPTGSSVLSPTFCGPSSGVAVGQVAQQIGDMQKQLQTLTPFSTTTPNPGYAGTLISQGLNINATVPGSQMLAPDYRTPRALQFNVGVEREIRKGMVLSVDYVRNVATQFLLATDKNHVGDVRFFNKTGALAAISATNQAFGCGTGTDSASINCAIAAGAQISNYAQNGMGSPALDFGGTCPLAGGCAFPGMNPAFPMVGMGSPSGRAVYNALQTKLVGELHHPTPGVKNVHLLASYNLSRFVSPGAGTFQSPSQSDLDQLNNALDNANPLRYMGPNLLDRKQQFSLGTTADLAYGMRVSIISHFYSPLPEPLVVPNTGLGPGEIFRTDFTGDGTVGDPLPGTKMGAFGRGISPGGLNQVLQSYNSTIAGQPTPAGQTLITNGLFSLSQLQSLGATAPTVPLAPAGQVGLSWLRSLDMRLAWSHTFADRLVVSPSVSMFNLPNFANFDLPPAVLSPKLNGSPGSVNGTTAKDRIANRLGMGSGLFALGSPRVAEFGLKIDF